MKRTFLTTLLLFLIVLVCFAIDLSIRRRGRSGGEFALSESLSIVSQSVSVRAQVDEIDRQITELEGMKRGFEARARRHDDQIQRLQFEDRALLETRRHSELAQENRMKAQKIQEEINRLQEERRRLLYG